MDVAELGRALADSSGHVRDGAAARGTDRSEAGGDVSVFERGLVALDRARADARALAGVVIGLAPRVSARGRNSNSAVGSRASNELCNRADRADLSLKSGLPKRLTFIERLCRTDRIKCATSKKN